jgi:hypothetical protein
MSEHRRARLLKRATVELKPVTRTIDWGCLDRLSQYAADCRAEMGEDRWAEHQKEWNA